MVKLSISYLIACSLSKASLNSANSFIYSYFSKKTTILNGTLVYIASMVVGQASPSSRKGVTGLEYGFLPWAFSNPLGSRFFSEKLIAILLLSTERHYVIKSHIFTDPINNFLKKNMAISSFLEKSFSREQVDRRKNNET